MSQRILLVCGPPKKWYRGETIGLQCLTRQQHVNGNDPLKAVLTELIV